MFDEAQARADFACIGKTAVQERIAALLIEGVCECPAKNLSGACCLGEVIKAVKRSHAERRAAGETIF